MKRLLIWAIGLALVGGGAYISWRWYAQGREPAGTEFRTAEVKRTTVVATITATGTVVPRDVVDVGAQVNGQIDSFGSDESGSPVDYGSHVEEGKTLATIDDSLYAADVAAGEAQVAQAQAQVRVAEATRDQAQARLYQAQRDWDRAQKLGETKALSQADYDAAKSAFDAAQATLALAEAQIGQAHAAVAMAQATLKRAQRNLSYCVIKSPVSGVVIDRRVEIGQTVVASLNAPSLFLIARDLKQMEVLVQVNEADISHVKSGQHVTFTVDALPGRTFDGTVRMVRLNATMTQNVVTYTVQIETDNNDMALLPYLTANVSFQIGRAENVLAVPGAALRFTPSSRELAAVGSEAPTGGGGKATHKAPPPGVKTGTVWIVTADGARPVQVTTGLSDGAVTQVAGGGLQDGDRVIIGEAPAAAGGASGGGSPFTPQLFRRNRSR